MVQSRLSDDISAELPGYLAAAEPDTIVLYEGGGSAEALGSDGTIQLVCLMRPLPAAPSAMVVRWVRGSGGDAAVQVGAQLAVASGLDLVLTPESRQCSALVADLTKRGLQARSGTQPADAIVVASADGDGDVHLLVVAGSNEASDDMDHWVQALDGRYARDKASQTSQPVTSQQESRQL